MIDAKTLQTFLKTGGYYAGAVDGIFGPMSFAASRAALMSDSINASIWPNERVMIALNQLFLNKVNDAQLVVDGAYGPRTSDALYIYTTTQLQPSINTYWPRQADVRAGTSIFGKPGTNLAQVKLPYLMYGDYARKIKVTQFPAHAKIAASIKRIFQRTLDHYGPTQIRALNLDIFSGCYNYRPVVGGSGSLSMHAWGVAIDTDAAHNQMYDGSADAAFSKPVYSPFLDFFEAEGWVSLGRARNRDWMHVQCPRF